MSKETNNVVYDFQQVTLYEVLGYLLPGAITLTALLIAFWTLYMPHSSLALTELSVQACIALLALAYFLGHLVQAIGSLCKQFKNWCLRKKTTEEVVISQLDQTIAEQAYLNAGRALGLNTDSIEKIKEKIKPADLYRVCDEILVQQGVRTNRDMFEYRKGFYRGTTVSLVALTLALIFRVVISGASLVIAGKTIGSSALWFFLIPSLVGLPLTFERYEKFSKYRIICAIRGSLILKGMTDQDNSLVNLTKRDRILSSQ